jgi:hypothetical protein
MRNLKSLTIVAAGAAAILSVAAVSASATSGGHHHQHSAPLRVIVNTPLPGARAGAGGTFTVDVALAARNRRGNDLLAGYQPGFIDPHTPAFHPGANANAPGLVVLLSTTPTVRGTPLQGPNTNLAGVFQINEISKLHGLKRTLNSWIVGSPGFFGRGQRATLTVFAVRGTAPDVVTGDEHPVSDVVTEQFTIAS